jgi:hypothetical protein
MGLSFLDVTRARLCIITGEGQPIKLHLKPQLENAVFPHLQVVSTLVYRPNRAARAAHIQPRKELISSQRGA